MVDYCYSGVSGGKGDITMKIKNGIIRLSKWLNQNTGLILIGILIFFGASILQFQSDNQKLLENTKTSVDNSQLILKNQEESLRVLQADNKVLRDDVAQLKRFTACLLAAHGANGEIAQDVEAQCEKMSFNVGIEDVKKTEPANPVPQNNSADPQSSPQPAPNEPQPEAPPEPQPSIIRQIINFINPF